MSKSTLRQPPLRVVQITDPHLGERVGTRLLSVDTDQSLAAVLDRVREQQPHIDVLLATGDLSDQGSTASYRRFLQATRELGEHARWLPGNHDEPAALHRALGNDPRLQRNLLLGNWQIVMLDSSVRGEVGGFLAETELAALKACLEAHPDHFAVICVHHQVVPVGCAWLDRQRIVNADVFWALVSNHPQVRMVLSGHVHQGFEQRHDDVRVVTSPSTCIQFAPHSDDFSIGTEMPGYRWLDLYDDGSIHTEIERVTGFDMQVDRSATGY